MADEAGLAEQIDALLRDKRHSPLRLASAVWQLHQLEGPTAFQELWMTGRIARRRAYYLSKIGRKLDELALSGEDVERVGWTKLTVLVPALTAENIGKLISLALVSTVSELKERIATVALGRPQRQMVLTLSPEDHALIIEALVQRGASWRKNGFRNAGEAFRALVRDAEAGKASLSEN